LNLLLSSHANMTVSLSDNKGSRCAYFCKQTKVVPRKHAFSSFLRRMETHFLLEIN